MGYDLNVTGFLIFIAIVGAIMGVLLFLGASWVWEFIGPWLHAITAPI